MDEENDEIRSYFSKGFSYKEIQGMILQSRGTYISVDALKKRRQRLGLRKRRGVPVSTLQEIRVAMQANLADFPSTVGYRNMRDTLRLQGLDVRTSTVMSLMRELDAPGVEQRRRRRLQRRQYSNPGPNYSWHMDGYDKLKYYGFAIHGCMDGYSRRLLWLEVNPSNNDPHFVANYYVECVENLGGCPEVLCSDCGSENVVIAALQTMFHEFGENNTPGAGHRYCKSTRNQRIEAWWCFQRRDRIDWWIHFFKRLSETGEFNKGNVVETYCLRYSFMPVLKALLYDVKERWNVHRINATRRSVCPGGRPDVLFATGTNYLRQVSPDDVAYALQQTNTQSTSGSDDFDEYADSVCTAMRLPVAQNWQEALDNYFILRTVAKYGS